MVAVGGGGEGTGLSEGGAGDTGLMGGVMGRRAVEAEGESGGEHTPSHPGHFAFDDNHWKVGKQRDREVSSGCECVRTSIRWSKQKHCRQQSTFLGLIAGSKLCEGEDGSR